MKSAIKDGLKPEPLLTVSEWADKNRVLNSASAAEAGLYRTSRTPFLKEIMDKLSEHSETEEIIIMKGAQMGVTEAALNWIGYTVDISPCPMLYVGPTKEVIELVSKTRVQPMFDDSPSLTKKVKPQRSRDSGNTLTKKEFPGGILRMVGANSAAGLRNMPVKRLILDEVDAYPLDLDGEGNPVELARKRTSTFSKRKILILSTPTEKGLSLIESLFETTDKRYWHIPCPHCGTMQYLKWGQLRYTYIEVSKETKDVFYECEHCSGKIEEKDKTKLLDAGDWIATDPAKINRKRIGFHLSSLYSPLGWLSWVDLVKEWEEAQKDEPKLKTFYNTSLGESYEATGEKPEWNILYEKRMDYPINRIPSDSIVFLTAGVDIQKDRIEIEIVGWSKGKTSYSVDYRVLNGQTSGADSEVWKKLKNILDESWQRPDGSILPIRMMCIDSGYNPSEVYTFCIKQSANRVLPIKGKDEQPTILSAPKAVNVTKKNKPIGKTKVWHVGVSVIKAELYGWLQLNEGESGYCYFPQYSEEYFKGLTAEELVTTKNSKGQNVQAWIKKYRRNEPLDCRIYARAAAHLVGMDSWTDKQWDDFRMISQTITSKPKPKRKSSFL